VTVDTDNYQSIAISWWSWRPGIKPHTALLLGALISCIAFLFATIGLISLVLAILDSVSPPLHIPGMVLGHSINGITGQANLFIGLHSADFPSHISAITGTSTLQTIHDGDHIFLDYSPHLHMLTALESSEQRFLLQNGGMFSIFLGVFALLFLGFLLLPYPVLLTRWAWLDLHGHNEDERTRKLTGKVIALRAAKQTRAGRPGLTPRPTHTWYGVALSLPPAATPLKQQIITFAISREMYEALHEGETVRVTYSPHIQYVFAMESSNE
jgi:hypothetical protein